VHAGEEDYARLGWTTSIRGQDSPWNSQLEWQRTDINGESTSMVWPTLGSRTAKEQNRSGIDLLTANGITTNSLVTGISNQGDYRLRFDRVGSRFLEHCVAY